MAKRGHTTTDGDVDAEAPRSKRRRDTETPATTTDIVEKEEPSSDAEAAELENTDDMSAEELRDAGRAVLQMLREVVDKE